MDLRSKTERCFGGMNCDIGYVGYYDDCFHGAERLYVIKGGPGTGKSHLMKEIAKNALAKGEAVRFIHCGSDATSLDGVYLPNRRIGVLDGTAPHPKEPKLPGIDGEIWNLGQFWNSTTLRGAKEEILTRAKEKEALYTSVYRTFSAMRNLRLDLREAILSTLDREKIEKAARRTVEAIRGEGEERICQSRAVGMGGEIDLSRVQDSIFIGVRDEFACGYYYLEALRAQAKQKGIPCLLSYHPIYHDEPQKISFPTVGVTYTSAPEPEVARCMHLRRFRDREAFVRLRAECKELQRLADSLYDRALLYFSHLREVHFNIERIYTSAMDFDAIDNFTKKQLTVLLGK